MNADCIGHTDVQVADMDSAIVDVQRLPRKFKESKEASIQMLVGAENLGN